MGTASRYMAGVGASVAERNILPMTISLEVKRKCVEMKREGKTSTEIYRDYFSTVHEGMSYPTFKAKLKHWAKQAFADPETLKSGTYPGFVAHGATVQVNGKGEIVQVWVKEHTDDNQMAQLLETIGKNTTPVLIERTEVADTEPEMLEIPLFDQHFPQNDHINTFIELSKIVESRSWDEIDVIIGQDMLHNDDMRGRTASGTPIEKVDIVKGWELARIFYTSLLKCCLEHTNRLKITYSKGNHDESLTWAFIQMLKAMFPQAEFDDSLRQRKCIFWNGCFIGITHGAYKKSSMEDMRGQFTIQFPVEFASAKVREIHAGHLHREEERDIYGVMLRRLSRKGVEDEWTDDEGFVGANKRFMVFRWKPGRLAAIEYV